jgi:hypothetical protein
MKSPEELRQKLARQWELPSVRLNQLLNPLAWPMVLNIGKPSAQCFNLHTSNVQRHVEAWREVNVGTIEWADVAYRSGAETVSVPMKWCLRNPSEWVVAASCRSVSEEYAALGYLVERVPGHFRQLLIARRSLWKDKPKEEVIQAAVLAPQLSPGCAQGLPLRLLSGYGVDTKFFERNELLLRKMLDVLFEGEASVQGLCGFLDAYDDTSHWVLVTPLESGLLPFNRQQVTTSELAQVALPGTRLLIVENQKCLHQLLELPETIAVLGCGLDLEWLCSAQLRDKSVAYWGDIDTWGLRMLARARVKHIKVTSLLMSEDVYDAHKSRSAVREPVRAQDTPPAGLTSDEAALFVRLVASQKGRLEQEFIPRQEVWAVLERWVSSQGEAKF